MELDLTFDSFVIDDRSSASLGRGPKFWGKRRMGRFNEIKLRSEECELCQLLVKSMENKPKSSGAPANIDEAAVCMLFWTVDGRERVQSTESTPSYTVKRTRRLSIEWQSATAKIDTSYIVLIAPDGKFLPDGTVNPQGERGEQSTFFLGRKLTSLEKANTELVRDWLHLCSNHHVDCVIDHGDPRFRDLLPEPFFTVVDVDRMCLSGLPEGAKYLALSYTWGDSSESSAHASPSAQTVRDTSDALQVTNQETQNASQAQEDIHVTTTYNATHDTIHHQHQSTRAPADRFRTTTDMHRELQKDNGIGDLLPHIPKTIQNAIALTRHLGFKYIWIDSLCIVQDDADSWPQNARVMDVVYGNAELTICGADGDSVDMGLAALFAPRGEANKASFRPADNQEIIRKYRLRQPQHAWLELMLSFPSESYVECSRWNDRAWTFQERMISPRCLICVNQRVYFQCRTTTMSEDIYSDVKTAQGSAGWSVELYGAPAQTLKRLTIDPISVYKDCLRMYTSRKLTYERDTLSAFAGIGNVITQYLGHSDDYEEDSTLIFGLPASHFDYALLWQPVEVPTTRILNNAIFPSWSWSGWRCGKGVSYRRTAVSGPEINLYEWLQHRTWITWYIRNAKGQLRLVWDPVRYKQNRAIEQRWWGYNTPERGFPTATNNLDPEWDYHGRPFRKDLPIRGRVHENAFPTRDQFEEKIQPFLSRNRMMPPGVKRKGGQDKPYLQFWTWWARFYVRLEPDEEQFVKVNSPAGDGLKRYAILDRHQDFAGIVLLDAAWSENVSKSMPQEFIAISDARDFDESEYGYWNLYIEEDQSAVPWQMYNVLMIVRNDLNARKGDNIAFRRGLGKIYKKAFEHACLESANENGDVPKHPIWKEIVLG